MTSDKFESRVAITGVGMSEVGRRLMRDPMALLYEAATQAIADAGLTRDQIDGLSTYPGGSMGLSGISGVGIYDAEELLRIHPKWFNGGEETAGQCGSVITAAMAIAAGMCTHVLCFRVVWEATHQAMVRDGTIRASGGRVSGEMEWRFPYGAASAANWIGMQAVRHMHEYGTTREHLGHLALNARTNAGRNPAAIYRDPITMDDYLSARPVTTPFGLYDCDVPCDGAVAVVVSAIDAARDCAKPPVLLDAVGTQIAERVSWDQGTLTHEPLVEGPANHLWTRTDLTPADVDFAQLYDGFTFNCLTWIEALGFCAEGEGGPWLDEGRRIALDGELPLNTHGGQLSAGRLHGYGFLHEAVVQLRGEGGARQIPGGPEVGVVSFGGGHPGGVMLLTVDR